MVTGVVGVWLSIKEKIAAWPLFILCYLSYVYISFRSGYFAFGGMNIIFVAVAGYGWFNWGTADENPQTEKVTISHIGARPLLIIGLLIGLGTLGIGGLLSFREEARLPYFDAFATSCALCAQWMLSRKYAENWLLWIASDLVYLTFFFNDQVWPSVLLFGIFIYLATKGWFEWKAIIQRKELPATS